MPVRKAPFKIETPTTKRRFMKMLIYGRHGIGKTTLAASATEVETMKDILIIDAEAGDLSLLGFEGIDTITVSTFEQVSKILHFLKVHHDFWVKGDLEKLCRLQEQVTGQEEGTVTEPKKYLTIIIDSLTEVEALVMNQLLGIGANVQLHDDVGSAEWSEYKKNKNMIERMVREFKNLPMHIIMICSESYSQDETKKMLFQPSMTGKLSRSIQGFFDIVGFLTNAIGTDGKPIRRLHVQPAAGYDAKCRIASFKGDHFDDPTIGRILKEVGLLQ